jgi:hypothetical protein
MHIIETSRMFPPLRVPAEIAGLQRRQDTVSSITR